ncbi:hypothetical protein FVE85_2670 [Porphyridium purpureum]|uniref:CCHC-type domain-containing protein n=1 Tax=Porphyridium purpureum TaxID=35688 RepID=A0A5J4YSP9_PORPP|nr:hypothetical protein FVE85_2670 [Porphyridium purpureum]|eukprot:POR1891..scf227_4
MAARANKGKETYPRKGVVESLPILEFNAAHMRPAYEVVAWLRALEHYTKAEFGSIGAIFEMDQARAHYPSGPGIPAAQEPENWREREFARLQIQAYAEWHKHTTLVREKICGLIVGQLSRTSLDVLETMSAWKDLTAAGNDPLEMKKLIVVMHMTPVGASDMKRKTFARARFQETAMENGETIEQFRERFSAAVMVMALVQEAGMEEERIAEEFLQNVAVGKYEEAVRNAANTGRALATVNEVVQYLQTYHYATNTSSKTFAIRAQSSSISQDTPVVKPCGICKKKGHYARTCPLKTKDKGTNDSKLVLELRKEIESLKAEMEKMATKSEASGQRPREGHTKFADWAKHRGDDESRESSGTDSEE